MFPAYFFYMRQFFFAHTVVFEATLQTKKFVMLQVPDLTEEDGLNTAKNCCAPIIFNIPIPYVITAISLNGTEG